MAKEKPSPSQKKEERGYQPYKKGHQPTQGTLDTSKPPQGGSGVPQKPNSSSTNKPKNQK